MCTLDVGVVHIENWYAGQEIHQEGGSVHRAPHQALGASPHNLTDMQFEKSFFVIIQLSTSLILIEL